MLTVYQYTIFNADNGMEIQYHPTLHEARCIICKFFQVLKRKSPHMKIFAMVWLISGVLL